MASKLWRPLLLLWVLLAALTGAAVSAWTSLAEPDALLPDLTLYSPAKAGCDPSVPSTCTIRKKSRPDLAVRFPTAASRTAVFGMYAIAPSYALTRFVRSLRTDSDADVYVATDSG